MNYPEYVVLSLVFFGLAGYVAYESNKLRRKINDIIATPTSNIAALLKSPKTRGRMVEVKGNLVAGEQLLRSPYTDRDCVFFHAVKKDKVKEIYRDMGGKKKSRTHHVTVEEFRSSQIFYIEDKTGRIAVEPEGLEIEGLQVMNTKRAQDSEATGLLGMFAAPGDYRLATLKEEHILMENKPVYAIGELFHGLKYPFIGASIEKNCTALVSIKTEEAILQEKQRQLYMYALACAAVAIAGVVFLTMAR